MKIIALAGLFLLTIGVVRAVSATDEDAKLAAFFDKYLDEQFRRHPFAASRAGDHRYDDRLDDLSPKAQGADRDAVKSAAERLPKEVNKSKLSRDGQIDFEILEHNLKSQLWSMERVRPYEEDPRLYNEYLSDSVYLLLTQSTRPAAENVRNAAARMAYIPKIVEAAKQSLKNPPRIRTETVIKQNKGTINFYQGGIFKLTGETPQLSLLAEPARKAVEVLKEYQTFLEQELLPRSTADWRIGKEAFAKKLDLELNAGISADDVLRLAEQEALRVEREMVVIARQLWSNLFPKMPLPADDPQGRRDLVHRVMGELSKDHGKAENLTEDAKSSVKSICQFIKEKDILRLPEPDRCQIIEMPEFQRGFSVAFLNPAPPLDPKASSIYTVSPPPSDWDLRTVNTYLREYDRPMLQILTIHEAYPGHYVQLEYSNRCPSKIRRMMESGVFVEGWAVYTEQMMLDQGYGAGDLSLRLHQLKWYLRSVVNAILDHRMHCTNMTDDEAKSILMDRAFQSEGEALGKITRAKLSSCQLSTYFVGRMAHYQLRQEIQRELGDKFELGRFHEAVLAHGSPPVKYLPELVRQRLAQPR